MSRMTLEVNEIHISAASADLVRSRIESREGASFFRQGERMAPMFGAFTFNIDRFGEIYGRDAERLEKAMPHDLLFLHLFAQAKGCNELVISPAGEVDPRLPTYNGNSLADVGDLLRDKVVKFSERKPRQLPDGARLVAVAPRQIREGRLELAREPSTENLPEP